jgi:hypothetical protein
VQGPQSLEDVMALMRMEFMEMPDMRLTLGQARRLWDLRSEVCETALAKLVQNGFLARLPDGSFLKRTSMTERIDAVLRAM